MLRLLCSCVLMLAFCSGCDDTSIHISTGPGLDANIRVQSAPVRNDAPGALHPVGIPVGPYGLPTSEFDQPFYSGTYTIVTPQNAITVIDQAEDQFFDLYINLAGDRANYQNPDSTFCLPCFKSRLDEFVGIDFTPYALNATIRGHILLVDPHKPELWGGSPVALADLDSAAAYARQLFPTMSTGVIASATFVVQGAPYEDLDFCITTYSLENGSFGTFFASELSAARSVQMGLVFNLEAASSTGGGPMTAWQVQNWGKKLICETYVLGVFLGEYDSTYFSDPAMRDAMRRLTRLASYGYYEDIQCGVADR